MIYPYICPKCGREDEVYKPVKDAGKQEICNCGNVLTRVFTAIQINVSQDGSQWNAGLGCKERDKNDKMKQLADGTTFTYRDTGGNIIKKEQPPVEMVEVGTEKLKLKSKRNWDFTSKEMAGMSEILDKSK